MEAHLKSFSTTFLYFILVFPYFDHSSFIISAIISGSRKKHEPLPLKFTSPRSVRSLAEHAEMNHDELEAKLPAESYRRRRINIDATSDGRLSSQIMVNIFFRLSDNRMLFTGEGRLHFQLVPREC